MSKMLVRFSIGCLMVAGLLLVALGQQSGNGSSSPTDSPSQSGASNSNSGAPKWSTGDQKFVKEAAQGGMAEVELGQLAVAKGSSADVKAFGQRMVDDHTQASDKLKQLASKKGIQLPSNLDAKDRATKLRLSKLSGEQFDKAYMQDMVQDHKKDVAAFEQESNSGADADIKNFARQTLPTLESHLKAAETIAPKVMGASENTPQSSMHH